MNTDTETNTTVLDHPPNRAPSGDLPVHPAGRRLLTLLLAFFVAITVVALPEPADAKTRSGRMSAGTTMRRGDVLKSGNGACRLVFQQDQNVVLYHGSQALWSTRTVSSGADRLVMQGDGNLVLYDGRHPEWNSRTHRNNGAHVTMQDDCNLVIYKNGRALWSTRTHRTTTKVDPKISVSRGPSAPHGYWYRVALRGYPANSTVTLKCHDSVDRGFYSRRVKVNSQGAATLNLCYSGDGPDHWVTEGSRSSNRVRWGGATGGSTPTPTITTPVTVVRDPKPSGSVKTPSPTVRPRPSVPSPGGITDGYNAMTPFVLANLGGLEHAASMAYHYGSRSGSTYTIPMGELIWEERPLWAVLEWHLRAEATEAHRASALQHPRASISYPLDTGWIGYSATGLSNDWYWALGSFSVRLKGDLWIGPSRADGSREVQLRYRVFMFDVYDFREGSLIRRLHDTGQAAEFLVVGAGATRTFSYSSTSFRPDTLGLNW